MESLNTTMKQYWSVYSNSHNLFSKWKVSHPCTFSFFFYLFVSIVWIFHLSHDSYPSSCLPGHSTQIKYPWCYPYGNNDFTVAREGAFLHFPFQFWPLTFLASHKYTFGSSSLSIYCPTHQLLLQIIKVIWIPSLPFVILDVLESVALILMIKFHIPIFFIIIENVKLQIFRNNTWNLIIYFQQQKRLLVNILCTISQLIMFFISHSMCVLKEKKT